jgi:uncharacterized protein (TIGR03032 family)
MSGKWRARGATKPKESSLESETPAKSPSAPMREAETPEMPAMPGPPQPIEWVARGDFVAILEKLRISLVLSTRPNHVIFLGASEGQLTRTATLVAQPMGLAAEPDRIAIATARSIIVFANVARLAAHYPGRRDYYDAFFAPRTIYFTGDCHMHDMVFSGDDVIGANTNFSCICRIDGKHSFTPLWRPSFISKLRPEDRCHLNGFAGEQGELRYVTALSSTDSEGGWRETLDTDGILIDAKANTIMRSDLCMPHSPRIIENELYLLNGGEGELLRVDRACGRSEVVAGLPGFTHGLVGYGGLLFVGLSQNRASRKKNPPPLSRRVEKLMAGVAVIEIRSGALLGALEFTSGVTEVYDVQVLPGICRAGMQSVVASDGFVAIDTPNSVFWTKRPKQDPQHVFDVTASGNYDVTFRMKVAEEENGSQAGGPTGALSS